MTKNYFSILATFLLSAALLSPAFGNHRTGSFALPELIVAGDLNEDGNIDYAVNVTGFDHIAFLLGDGQGGFVLSGRVPTDTLPKGLAIGDLNRDHHLDLVGCNNWGYDAEIHFGDGSGAFGFKDNQLNAEGGPSRLVLRDFNNDGALDIAVNGPDEGVALIYLGDNKGGFGLPPFEIEDNIPHPLAMTSDDWNGDGNFDLAFTAFANKDVGGTHVEVFFGDGTGEFPTHTEVSVGDLASSLSSGDLNGDGKVDMIVGGAGSENETGNFLQTFLGDGTGNFTLKQTIPLENPGSNRGEFAVGDLNGDGKLDVAFPAESAGGRHVDSTTVHIFFGDGTGNLALAYDLMVGSEPHTVIAADVNKDGHLDLAVSNRTDGTITTYLNDGAGNFTLSSSISVVCEGGVCE